MKTFSIKPSKKEKSDLIKCPLCGDDYFQNHWQCDGYSFAICNNCNLILQNPQPKFEFLDSRYEDEYFLYEKENDQIFFRLMLKGLKDVGFSGIKEKLCFEKSFIDIGCATGLLVEHMQNLGWRSKGVELCAPAAEFGCRERGIDIFSGTIEQTHYSDNSFDIVHCSHLIEHLNNPDLFLDEVYRILKPGGLLFCTTPNVSGFQAKLFRSKWRSAIADHMFLFSVKTLKQLLENKGFYVKKVKTWGGLGKGCGSRMLKKPMDFLAKKFNFGDVMIFSAEKQKSLN